MVLVDAGAVSKTLDRTSKPTDSMKQYGGYISDVTRTFPNSGKFTGAQGDLYQVVLNVQRSCVSLCREDANLSLDKLHKIAEKGLKDGLKDLGFDVSGNVSNSVHSGVNFRLNATRL
jgi:Xaa-Pro aminopeptidase